MKITKEEIANALGVRDRIQGIDADGRNITLARFRGRQRLEQAYWNGFLEANHYVSNHYRWGAADQAKLMMVRGPARACLADAA